MKKNKKWGLDKDGYYFWKNGEKYRWQDAIAEALELLNKDEQKIRNNRK